MIHGWVVCFRRARRCGKRRTGQLLEVTLLAAERVEDVRQALAVIGQAEVQSISLFWENRNIALTGFVCVIDVFVCSVVSKTPPCFKQLCSA